MNKEIKISTDHKRYAYAGYALILAGFGGFLLWASTANIAAAVIAPGTVSVSSNRKVIQHLEGGIVAQLLVKDGTNVKAGDVLLQLEGTKAKAELDALVIQYDLGRILEARLTAERDDLRAFEYPDPTEGYELHSDIMDMMKAQRQLFEARIRSTDGELAVLDSRIVANEVKVEAFKRQRASLLEEIASYEEQLIGMSRLATQGVASKNAERELDRRIISLRTAMGDTDAEVATAESVIGEARLQKVLVAQQKRQEAMAELAKVREANAGLHEKIAVAKDVMRRTEIRSPQDGVVQALKFHASGAVIGAGEPILELVPDNDDLIIETNLPAVSIDQIHAGMQAEVKFPSFNARTTPLIFGKVISVSPDALPDKDGQRLSYVGRVEVLPASIPQELSERLQPGMVAEVVVPTEERTVLSYLLRPMIDALSRGFREK